MALALPLGSFEFSPTHSVVGGGEIFVGLDQISTP